MWTPRELSEGDEQRPQGLRRLGDLHRRVQGGAVVHQAAVAALQLLTQLPPHLHTLTLLKDSPSSRAASDQRRAAQWLTRSMRSVLGLRCFTMREYTPESRFSQWCMAAASRLRKSVGW